VHDNGGVGFLEGINTALSDVFVPPIPPDVIVIENKTISEDGNFSNLTLHDHINLSLAEDEERVLSRGEHTQIYSYSGPHENLSTRRVEIGTKNPDFLPPPSCMLGPFDPRR